MATQIRIPKLGWSMTEGVLVEWLVADGDTVEEGEIIYILETDKIQNEIAANVGGTIRIIAEPDETYPVGELVAEIDG